MNRLPIAVILLILALSSTALATVRPPDEWLRSADNRARWEEIFPQLNEMEFGETDPLPGPGVTRPSDLRPFLGRSVSEAVEANVEGRSLDLNLDGVINHFDLLELGYEVNRVTKTTSIAPSEGTAQWCVLRADFDDQAADYGTYDVNYFEDKFFNTGVTPPSANDYYQQVSYGKLEIDGAVATGGTGGDGWYRAQNSKGFYDASSNNARNLIFEMVMASDDDVDYSQFDVDKDGYVDTLIVFYAGPVWFGGGLHPHRWSGVNAHVDGVIVDSYFLTGYDTNDSYSMVITCHEYGHILGLPDLYDTDYSSEGLARWSLMANNYDDNQLIPSPDPWCKTQLGWVEPVVITENVNDYPLNAYETHPEVLKVWTNGQQEDQYFLICNMQQILTDQTRPGSGLLVMHCDDSRSNNRDEYRKWVDVESARGLDDPGSTQPRDPIDNGNSGHFNDLWYAGNTDTDFTGEFSSASNPTSNNYPAPGSGTSVRLSDFSASAALMTLDIEVTSANAPTVAITSHVDNDPESADITVTADATPVIGRSIDHVEFYLNGAYYGSDSTAPYEHSFQSNGVYDGLRPLKVIAVDDQGEIATDSVNINLSNTVESYPWSDQFDLGIAYWASYSFGGTQRWEDKSTNNTPPTSAGVGAETGGYDRNEHDLLVSPAIDMTSAGSPLVRWFQRYNVSSGENTAKLLVTSDDGANWDTLASYTGGNLNWHVVSADLSAYAGLTIRLGFRLDSSSLNWIGNGTGGFWVDDVTVKEQSAPPQILSVTPADGEVLTGLETITVDATDDEEIYSVQFILDGTTLATDTSAPFSTQWNSDLVFDQAVQFTAIATDTDGQSVSLDLDWTTFNPGLALPWNEDWEGAVEPFWQITNQAGAGFWHTRAGQGFGGTTAMFFGRDTQNYGRFQGDSLISPTLLIDNVTTPGLGMLHHYDMGDGDDFCIIYATTDFGTWTELAAFNSLNQPDWRADGLLLSDWMGERIKLNWFFYSDNNNHGDGYWLDDMTVREAPHIDSVSPGVLHEGDSVTVTGTNFGNDVPNEFATLLFGTAAASIVSWTPTEIQATVPAGATGAVTVLSRGIPSNTHQVVVRMAAPTLTEIGTTSN
ncbi:M6 family metalloprotease domain-containing protein [bacterium]|nr:M6 family metalloprotease domain-containing protein [bacterium]